MNVPASQAQDQPTIARRIRHPGHPGRGPAHRHDGDEYAAIGAIEPFWPEEAYLLLQYSQLVILLFNQILWPQSRWRR